MFSCIVCIPIWTGTVISVLAYITKTLDLSTIHEFIVPIFFLTCLLPTVSDTADEDVTFLYQLTRGMAGRSYGMNVARLANVPADIVTEATVRSHAMEERDLYYRSGQHLTIMG